MSDIEFSGIEFPGQDQLAWPGDNGLLPAIVQHAFDGRVLMQAYMNRDALAQTLRTGQVTFWSRSRQALWTKGETSGNVLKLTSIGTDCDSDSLLIAATPAGPTCHLGTDSCFDNGSAELPGLTFLATLERLVEQRDRDRPEGSYTTSLLESGVKRIAQKVGEEAVETALASVAGNTDEVLNETADLLYHLVVLLRSQGLSLRDALQTLESRHG